MKKFTSIFTLAAMMLAFAPAARAADMYANELVSYSATDIYTPQNMVGAPDQLYADFRDEDAFIKFDMGDGEEGQNGLKLYFYLLNFGASVRVTFYSAADVVLGTDYTQFSSNTTEWTAELIGSESFRYVRIESTDPEQWRLDAVQALAIVTPPAPTPAPTPEPEPEPIPVEEPVDGNGFRSNDLIKLANSDAVYVIGRDGKRHPFPNETTFFSWDYSFDDVTTVVPEIMTDYLVGGSVTIKPGSYLVKILSVPKVYAVAPDHTLHWITSEALAAEIYGQTWANIVVDVADGFWPDYTEGEAIYTEADTQGWGTETQPY